MLFAGVGTYDDFFINKNIQIFFVKKNFVRIRIRSGFRNRLILSGFRNRLIRIQQNDWIRIRTVFTRNKVGEVEGPA
jgi:hypothetical protein